MSEYTLFTKRVGLVGLVQTLATLKGLIILPILTKTLGATDYGIWAQILVTVSLLQPFVQLGFASSIVRFLPVKGKREIVQGIITALSVTLVTGAVVSLIFFLSSNYLAANFLKEESAALIIEIASPLIVLEALNVMASNSFRIFGQIKRYAIVSLLQTSLEIGLIAFFVLSGHGLMGAVISLLITRCIILLVMLHLIISYAGFAAPDFSLLRPFLVFGLPLIPTVIFELVVALSDRYVIGFFRGIASVGIYSAAYSIGGIISMFWSYIAYILGPTVFNLYDSNKIGEVKTYLSYSWKYLMMLSIPSAFGLSALAKPLLTSLTTPEFVSTGQFVVPLVALSMIFYGVQGIFGEVIQMSKHTKIFAIAFGTGAGLNLGLNVLFVPRWGVIAAAIVALIAYVLVAGIIYYQSRKYMIFDANPVFVIKSILASAVMTLAIWAFHPVGAVKIVLSVIIGAAIYFAVLFLLKGLTQAETRFFLQLFKETAKGVFNRR
jgi:O-antigen/teichoic acid export membrane protein